MSQSDPDPNKTENPSNHQVGGIAIANNTGDITVQGDLDASISADGDIVFGDYFIAVENADENWRVHWACRE